MLGRLGRVKRESRLQLSRAGIKGKLAGTGRRRTLHHGWLTDRARTYYIDDSGVMIARWKEIDGDWYYFHQDGAVNLGELTLDRGCYQFTGRGALASAFWGGSLLWLRG